MKTHVGKWLGQVEDAFGRLNEVHDRSQQALDAAVSNEWKLIDKVDVNEWNSQNSNIDASINLLNEMVWNMASTLRFDFGRKARFQPCGLFCSSSDNTVPV